MSSKISVVNVEALEDRRTDRDESPVDAVEEIPITKPKTSRTKKEVKVEHEDEDVINQVMTEKEPIKEETESKTIKTVELVQCPKCGKKLTQRVLKYSHMAVCPANENKPAKKTTNVKTVGGSEPQYGKYLDEGSNPMDSAKVQRLNRVQARREKYQHLISNAF